MSQPASPRPRSHGIATLWRPTSGRSFAQAFTLRQPTTSVLLQQLQALFGVAGARILPGERLRRWFGGYLIGGLPGAYLIALSDPTKAGMRGLAPAVLRADRGRCGGRRVG